MLIKQGDCLELMKEIPDGSVDMILTDLPYGITDCAFDVRIPFEPMWEHFKRVSKHYGLPMKLNDFGIISNTLGRQGCFFAPNTVDGYYSINSKAADVLAKTQELMFNINNKSLEKNAKTFLSVFIRELDYLDTAPNVFPKINIETEEDNIFFEWVFNADFRVGFTIVDNEKDSSWFLFLKNENITGSLSGNFEYVGYQFIIRKLLAIVLENT